MPTTSTSIDSTIGALVVGWGASMLPFGILCIQVYTYFSRYPKDSFALKSLVISIALLETVHQALIGHCVYFYAVTSYDEPLVLILRPVFSLSIQVIIGALVGAIVKLCFGLRVWKFSKGNYIITAVIMLLALAQLGFAALFTYRSHTLRLVQVSQLKDIATISLTLGVLADVVTAAALSYYLHRMRTGYARSDGIINRLILYSVNNGFFTSACSLLVLLLYNSMPDNFVFMAFYFFLCKLYANSCLATLNTRRFVRGKGTDREEGTGPTFVMVHNTVTSHVETGPVTPGQGKPEEFALTSTKSISSPFNTIHREVTIAQPDAAQYDYARGW